MEKDNEFQRMLHPILVQMPQTGGMTFFHVTAKLYLKGLFFPDILNVYRLFYKRQVPYIKMHVVKGNLFCYLKTSHLAP